MYAVKVVFYAPPALLVVDPVCVCVCVCVLTLYVCMYTHTSPPALLVLDPMCVCVCVCARARVSYLYAEVEIVAGRTRRRKESWAAVEGRRQWVRPTNPGWIWKKMGQVCTSGGGGGRLAVRFF